MIVRDQKQNEWIKQYTLSKQDFRKLILDKIERNGLKAQNVKQREIAQGLSQIAKCEHTGNEVLARHLKHLVNGRTSGWHSLLWEENTSY